MRMKHRRIAIAALMATTLLLGACRQAVDGGAGDSAAPSTSTSAEPGASSTPYTVDDY
jgi:hypothetical protein